MRSVSALVCQFLEVAVHCILFVRTVYPQEVFDRLFRFTCLFLPSSSLPDAHPPCLPPTIPPTPPKNGERRGWEGGGGDGL